METQEGIFADRTVYLGGTTKPKNHLGFCSRSSVTQIQYVHLCKSFSWRKLIGPGTNFRAIVISSEMGKFSQTFFYIVSFLGAKSNKLIYLQNVLMMQFFTKLNFLLCNHISFKNNSFRAFTAMGVNTYVITNISFILLC